jgi:hypothetical protein
VSGALPETERERQLRQLASLLLTHPDPDGHCMPLIGNQAEVTFESGMARALPARC